MRVFTTALPGVLILEPRVFQDGRGWFFESYHQRRYAEAGLPERFVQDNHSRSVPGTLRGLHYQLKHPQGKLVRCIRGTVLSAAVDIRRRAPTFGKWVGVELTEDNKRQLYIPPGFAHGFCVPERESDVEYKCRDFYHPEDERGVLWSDPMIAVTWPIAKPILSEKDSRYLPLAPDREDLPMYQA